MLLDPWEEIMYRIFKGFMIAIIAFMFGWLGASRYTMATLKVWYQPDSNHIRVQDYMGNIDSHHFSWE